MNDDDDVQWYSTVAMQELQELEKKVTKVKVKASDIIKSYIGETKDDSISIGDC